MKKGFYLIELMIVVAIIGLLAAIVIPSVVRDKRIRELRNKGILGEHEVYRETEDKKGTYNLPKQPLSPSRLVKTMCDDGWFIIRDLETGSQWLGWGLGNPQFISPFTSSDPIKPEADDI